MLYIVGLGTGLALIPALLTVELHFLTTIALSGIGKYLSDVMAS